MFLVPPPSRGRLGGDCLDNRGQLINPRLTSPFQGAEMYRVIASAPLHVGALSPPSQGGVGGEAPIPLSKVLEALGQLMMHQRGKDLLQLKEEALAGRVTVGVHVKG